MNTLPRKYVSCFFASRDDFLSFRRQWSRLVNSDHKHQLTAAHHLLYLILTGRDWRKAFTFPSQSNKLNNGYTPELYSALDVLGSRYRQQFLLSPFDGLVTPDMLEKVRQLLAHVLPNRPAGEPGGHPDCDAYIVSDVEMQENASND